MKNNFVDNKLGLQIADMLSSRGTCSSEDIDRFLILTTEIYLLAEKIRRGHLQTTVARRDRDLNRSESLYICDRD